MLAEEMGGGSGPSEWDRWGVAALPLPAPGALPGIAAQAGAAAGMSPPKRILTSGAAGGQRPPWPHTHSGAARAPQLSTSPCHTSPVSSVPGETEAQHYRGAALPLPT